MVVLVTLLQSAQDADGTQFIRLIHHHGLETAFQRLVFLEILLVFVEGGGTDGAQFASCQGRFQDVGGIHGTFASAGTHQRVDLVDEEDDASIALGHLVDDTLETLLKFTFVFGASHKCTHVEAVELLVLEVLGHVASHDTFGQSFHDGGLARAWLTY